MFIMQLKKSLLDRVFGHWNWKLVISSGLYRASQPVCREFFFNALTNIYKSLKVCQTVLNYMNFQHFAAHILFKCAAKLHFFGYCSASSKSLRTTDLVQRNRITFKDGEEKRWMKIILQFGIGISWNFSVSQRC